MNPDTQETPVVFFNLPLNEILEAAGNISALWWEEIGSDSKSITFRRAFGSHAEFESAVEEIKALLGDGADRYEVFSSGWQHPLLRKHRRAPLQRVARRVPFHESTRRAGNVLQ